MKKQEGVDALGTSWERREVSDEKPAKTWGKPPIGRAKRTPCAYSRDHAKVRVEGSVSEGSKAESIQHDLRR